MTDDTDVLLQLYQEDWAQARQSEEQRATLTNIILIIASAALGIVAQNNLTSEMLSLTIPLILLGLYGMVASEKLYERHQFHVERARAYRKRIAELHPNLQFDEAKAKAKVLHQKKFPVLHKVRLHYIWTTLHFAIAVLGVVLTIAIFM
jgi:hypothetical protein